MPTFADATSLNAAAPGRGLHGHASFPLLELDVVQDRLLADVWPNHAGLITPRCEWKLLS